MNGIGQPRPELLRGLLRDLAAGGRFGEGSVHGTSMEPTLQDGDRVWLVPATGRDVRVGDLVVQGGESGPIIHRFVGWWPTREGWRLLTKGDNLPLFDPPLCPDCLVGRVVARVRAGKVQRLEGMGIRFRERGRAAVSFVTGLTAEVWIRVRRAAHRPVGLPPD
jgi:signal peptidase I